MKINVGDYVRTKDGFIHKNENGEEFYENSIDVGIGTIPDVEGIWLDIERFFYVDKRDIIKSSPNIIDLVMKDDFVNGFRVVEIYENNRKKEPSRMVYCEFGNGFIGFYNEDIKSIITHEQIERVSYKVGEE